MPSTYPTSTTKLTPQRLNTAAPKDKSYKLSDPSTSGLFCSVQPGGTKTFCFGFTLNAKRCEVVIGRYPSISLSEAREKAIALRRQVERGEDPRAEKKAKKAAIKAKASNVPDENQFQTFAAKWQKDKGAGWSDSYAGQVQSRLDRFIFPKIGGRHLAEVKPIDILGIIQPLQTDTPNTAEGVRGIVQNIYNYAVQLLKVEHNPAAPLRGVVTVPPSENARHLSAKELGAFWVELGRQTGAHPSTICATRLMVYTLCRKGEILRLLWREVDMERGVITIPAERMKSNATHRVWLPQQAIDLLTVQRAITGSLDYVFPSAFRNNVPLGDATCNHLFRRLNFGVSDFSPHGTRATGATLLRENGFRRDVVEALLSHSEKGVAKHYHHMELAKERAEALAWYANEIDRLSAAHSAVRAEMEEATA